MKPYTDQQVLALSQVHRDVTEAYTIFDVVLRNSEDKYGHILLNNSNPRDVVFFHTLNEAQEEHEGRAMRAVLDYLIENYTSKATEIKGE